MQTSGKWAIAIHGGAGAISKSEAGEYEARYRAALKQVLEEGRRRLEAGESSLDVCEALVRMMEDDELFNAGKGATLTATGGAELDAAIMDGNSTEKGMRAGAVAGVKTVKNPVSLARRVMEKTPHVLLINGGAEQFAAAQGLEMVPNSYFVTPRRQMQLEEELRKRKSAAAEGPPSAGKYGTVGVVCVDQKGHLAAATSTGGMTGKMPGRVGDAPLIGAGTYANGEVAISCTGAGEQFIRHNVAGGIAARIGLLHESADAASRYYIERVLNPKDGGLILVDATGNIAMPYNSNGMYRGAADSKGRFEVRIWEE